MRSGKARKAFTLLFWIQPDVVFVNFISLLSLPTCPLKQLSTGYGAISVIA